MVNLFDKTDQLYQRKDPKKLRIEEFCHEVNFKYGVPLIILDLIQALTGFDMISQVKKEIDNPGNIVRLNPDNEDYLLYKINILEEFQDRAFAIFNDLGELDLALC